MSPATRFTRPRTSPSPYPSPRRTSWADDTFISCDEAEAALCNDRSSFVVRSDIMTLVPGHIKMPMIHPEPSAHILGFRELFNKAGRSRRQSPRVYGLLTDNQLFFPTPRTIMARHIYNYKTFNFAIDVDHICIRGTVYTCHGLGSISYVGIPGNRETAHFGERNKKTTCAVLEDFLYTPILQFIYKVQAVNNMILKTRASQPPDAEGKKNQTHLAL